LTGAIQQSSSIEKIAKFFGDGESIDGALDANCASVDAWTAQAWAAIAIIQFPR
jgi:hypothetical protein